MAGQRRGAEDDRNLWPDYLRIITELNPTWVVGENVPGLKSTMLDDIILDLEGAGYSVATFDIPAVALDAKHVRHRLFIVAHSIKDGAWVGRDKAGGQGRKSVDTWAAGIRQGNWPVGSSWVDTDGEAVAHSAERERNTGAEVEREVREQLGDGGIVHNADRPSEACVGNAASAGLPQRPAVTMGEPGAQSQSERPSRAGEFWAVEPGVGRVANGVSRRVDRLRGLGNAVVPQVAEFVGRMILEAVASGDSGSAQ